ncbi:hypothetical protein TSUD_386600 [Trifolium subterraneum]|uniref:Reverse transcriptase zinc-binding domain-containing protein n=1 Tax=Trifolium subterraneum TaxID=3900 RepID=A0A2Z6NBU2_TRISU|nr:hypothetical protein TSUD_386600 [Trifolium subterraneum]
MLLLNVLCSILYGVNVGDPNDAISDWFSNGVTKNVGNGRMTSFWFDPWLGGILLKTQFQRLFQVSAQSTNMVSEMGNWVEGQWVWDLRWRRDLFVWELNLLESLREILDRAIISTADDSWYWKHDSSGLYSDRLPTRQNLWQQGVIEDASAFMRVLYGLGLESDDHLFGSCNLISPIWYSILRWLGVEFMPFRGVLGFFEAFLGMGTGTFIVECLVDRVKLLSWKWFLEYGGCLVGSHWVRRIGGPLVACPTCRLSLSLSPSPWGVFLFSYLL